MRQRPTEFEGHEAFARIRGSTNEFDVRVGAIGEHVNVDVEVMSNCAQRC